jgi:hypothetical protein
MMTGLGLGDRTRAYVALETVTVFAAVSVLASGCTSSRPVPPSVSLPVPRSGAAAPARNAPTVLEVPIAATVPPLL